MDCYRLTMSSQRLDNTSGNDDDDMVIMKLDYHLPYHLIHQQNIVYIEKDEDNVEIHHENDEDNDESHHVTLNLINSIFLPCSFYNFIHIFTFSNFIHIFTSCQILF